jgi:hypothetical protein
LSQIFRGSTASSRIHSAASTLIANQQCQRRSRQCLS